MAYTCTARSTDEHVILTVAGDVDFAASEPLWKDVEPCIGPGKAVVVDCSGVAFLDSMGLRVLLQADALARERQVALTLAAPSRAVRRVLELAGVESVFSITEAAPGADAGPADDHVAAGPTPDPAA